MCLLIMLYRLEIGLGLFVLIQKIGKQQCVVQGRVVAVEPIAETFAALRHNVDAHRRHMRSRGVLPI